MSFMLTLFFLYHLYMATSGTTTNERSKRSDYKFHYEIKIEILNDWRDNYDSFKLNESDKRRY